MCRALLKIRVEIREEETESFWDGEGVSIWQTPVSSKYTCSISDWLCKANLQEHSKINKNKIKIFAWKDNFPSLTFQYPLKK